MLPTLPLNPNAASSIMPLSDEIDRAFWQTYRQALLMMLDAIERRLGISPTTAELRKEMRQRGQ